MIVNKNTKISKLIAENPDVIEIISSINKHFKKLKNPILRKVLAPRVTIADAAKIGGVTTNEFLNKLEESGFTIEAKMEEEIIVKTDSNSNSADEVVTNIVSLDVRPIIEGGSDPFKKIMELVKTLKVDQTLEIINSFEPIPLIHKLEKKGFKTWTEKQEKGTVHTFFKKEISTKEIEVKPEEEDSHKNFDETYKSFINKLKCIDVRHLEMPEPMTTILSELELLEEGYALFVDHKKVPQFLLPELKERGFEILYNKKSESHLQLLIFKKNIV